MKLQRFILSAAVPLSIAALLTGTTQRIKADAGAYAYFEGTNASGVCAVGKTQVELKSARITFTVPELAVGTYSETAPTVSTAYTFYNPADRDETLSLAFPFELVRDADPNNDWNGKDNCTFTCDGRALDYGVRYAYKSDKSACTDFLTAKDEPDDFYTPDMPVTEYVYSVTLNNVGQEGAVVKLKLKSDVRAKLLCGEDCTMGVSLDCRYLKFYANEGENTFSFYSLGGESEVVSAVCAADDECSVARLTEKKTVAFSDFVEAARPSAEILQADWYRAVVSYFNAVEHKGILRPLSGCTASDFIRWYVYSFNVPARSSVEHVVTAPLYPAARDSVTHFSYRLYTEFETFSSVGSVKVEINTPLYLVDTFVDTFVDFTKTEAGYEFACDDRLYDDFTFALSGSDVPYNFRPDKENTTSLALAIIILTCVFVAGAVVVGVLVVKNRRERKSYEEARRRYEMGLPAEGKIDGDKNAK